ncbi:MAG: DUF4142 domain-containing protein [Ferruginibacter sp.]
MKQTINFPLAILAAGLIFASCTDSKKEDTTTSTMADSVSTTTNSATTTDNSATMNTPTPAVTAEQEFINYAVPGNMNEIEWLKAGVQKGSKEVKDHAAMMLKDHEGLGTKVKAYLDAHKDLTMPTVDVANAVTINDKMGADWNKAWTDKMVDDHAGLLDKLKASSTTVKDDALLAIINPAIKTVEGHLAMVKMLQGKMK